MFKSKKLVLIFTVIMFTLIITVKAQDTTKVKVYNTCRIKSTPVIDGKLDDKVWEQGTWQGNFVQFQPYSGKKPTQKTDFKILYDDNNLYVAIRSFDTNADKIETRLARRDNNDGDWAGIAIDSYFDKRTSFVFIINAAGVKFDGKIINDGGDPDPTWNPVWYVKTSKDSEGWYAEMKIPFSQLRFTNNIKDMTWGLQLIRFIFRNQEQCFWQPVARDAPGFVSTEGLLTGLKNIKPKKEVAFMPYVMSSLETSPVDEDDPYSKPRYFNKTIGVDGKVAVTSDLTLNFSINPDFGQVEADPSEVNLSALELYLPEQRPFFVAGSNIFSFPIIMGGGTRNNLFYSRRVGRSPHYYPDLSDEEYIKMPSAARILGAFKLSGKTQKGWSLGVMESMTSKEFATIDSAGTERKQEVEPLTNYFNARVQKDLQEGNTIIGGMITATNRFIKDSALMFLPNAAYTGGIDFQKYFKNKTFLFSATLTGSNVQGTPESISDLQQAPQRFYQRQGSPRSVDSTLTALSGTGASFDFSKIANGHWLYGIKANMQSPGLSLNDQGYMQLSDIIQHTGWLQYHIWEPFSIFKSVVFSVSESSGWDFNGTMTYSGQHFYVGSQFKNNWYFEMNLSKQGYELERHELRGGPALLIPRGYGYYFGGSSDHTKKINFGIGYSVNKGIEGDRYSHYFSLNVNYHPLPSLVIKFNPTYNDSFRSLAYVDATSYGNEGYIVSSISQKQLSANFRLNLSFSPNLSLEYWGQPFLFSADYSEFKKVVNPNQKDFESQFKVFSPGEISYDAVNEEYYVDETGNGATDFEFANPDFSVFNFRSNMVLRWEFVPGSTLYLVWSQNKSDSNSDGNFNFNRNIRMLSDIKPSNIFLVKFSYRFSM